MRCWYFLTPGRWRSAPGSDFPAWAAMSFSGFKPCRISAFFSGSENQFPQFLLRIPPVPWAMDKYLLRRSQIGILPDEIRLRPKTPVLQDVLLLHASSGKWNPSAIGPSPSLMQDFVSWSKLIECLKQLPNESLYLHLRPLALSRWLEIVDIRGSNRYSP